MTSAPDARQQTTAVDPKRAVPVILFLFVFSLIVDNGFKFASKSIGTDLGLDASTVSLQATLAGVVIGIGAVVYATLADMVSIRKLLMVAVGLICVGSLIGFTFRGSFPLIVTGRIVQTLGLAAAETLYVIYVTKYLPRGEQKRYLGFSTAAFQLSLLLGAVASSFIADYIHWSVFFLVALATVFALPSLRRAVPAEQAAAGHIDGLGLVLVAVFASSVMLFMQAFAWIWGAVAVLGAIAFVLHVRFGERTLVDRAFFAEPRYPSMLAVVFVLYSAQLAYFFLFPFLLGDLYGLSDSQSSLLLAPGYVCAVLTGIFSGRIGQVLDSKKAITLAIGMMLVALIGPAIMPRAGLWVFGVSIVLFASSFALLYAPLVTTAIRDIAPERSGVAIGFYNLTINIAVPLGIAYVAKLKDLAPQFLSALTTARDTQAVAYSGILWIIALIVLVAFVIYRTALVALQRKDAREGWTPPVEENPVA